MAECRIQWYTINEGRQNVTRSDVWIKDGKIQQDTFVWKKDGRMIFYWRVAECKNGVMQCNNTVINEWRMTKCNRTMINEWMMAACKQSVKRIKDDKRWGTWMKDVRM